MTGGRLAYRVREAAEAAGVSRRAVERLVARGEIRSKHVGGVLLLDPKDVEQVLGFTPGPEPPDVSAEARAIARKWGLG